MIIWHGMESRPIDPGRSSLRAHNQLEMCFSAVVLMQNGQFDRANGYSNDCWGRGLEDMDLKARLERTGLKTEHRKGTFQPLDHKHEGYEGSLPTTVHARNNAPFISRWEAAPNDTWRSEGLHTADYTIARQQPITPPMGTRADITMRHVGVEFPHRAPA